MKDMKELVEERRRLESLSDADLKETAFVLSICHWCPCEDYRQYSKLVRCWPLDIARQEMINRGLKEGRRMKFAEMPKTYAELCAIEMPRVLGSREDFDRVYPIITAMAGHELTKDQADYLETLSILVEAWERDNCEFLEVTP